MNAKTKILLHIKENEPSSIIRIINKTAYNVRTVQRVLRILRTLKLISYDSMPPKRGVPSLPARPEITALGEKVLKVAIEQDVHIFRALRILEGSEDV